LAEDLSVRKVEELARQLSAGPTQPEATEKPNEPSEPSREIAQLQSRLSSHFGTKVNIKSDGQKGEIKIPFLSVTDLNRILDILKF
jgi:ParB family chromosome partitioning protein